jgi:hypothetical protein
MPFHRAEDEKNALSMHGLDWQRADGLLAYASVGLPDLKSTTLK